jgi:hypothetical protein
MKRKGTGYSVMGALDRVAEFVWTSMKVIWWITALFWGPQYVVFSLFHGWLQGLLGIAAIFAAILTLKAIIKFDGDAERVRYLRERGIEVREYCGPDPFTPTGRLEIVCRGDKAQYIVECLQARGSYRD